VLNVLALPFRGRRVVSLYAQSYDAEHAGILHHGHSVADRVTLRDKGNDFFTNPGDDKPLLSIGAKQ